MMQFLETGLAVQVDGFAGRVVAHVTHRVWGYQVEVWELWWETGDVSHEARLVSGSYPGWLTDLEGRDLVGGCAPADLEILVTRHEAAWAAADEG